MEEEDSPPRASPAACAASRTDTRQDDRLLSARRGRQLAQRAVSLSAASQCVPRGCDRCRAGGVSAAPPHSHSVPDSSPRCMWCAVKSTSSEGTSSGSCAGSPARGSARTTTARGDGREGAGVDR
eukprot:5849263-Prymnesium_polylepis.1